MVQRFVGIGPNRFQFLAAARHVRSEGARITAVLDQWRPRDLWLGLTLEQWGLIQKDPKNLDPYERRVVARVAATDQAEPFAVERAVGNWAGREGARLHMLLQEPQRPPRKRDLWALDRMVRREGIDAKDGVAATRRFHDHYAQRIPHLQGWLAARQDQMAHGLAASHVGGAVILTIPDCDGVADKLQRLGKSNHS